MIEFLLVATIILMGLAIGEAWSESEIIKWAGKKLLINNLDPLPVGKRAWTINH